MRVTRCVCALMIIVAAFPAYAQSPDPAFRGPDGEQQSPGSAPFIVLPQETGGSSIQLPNPTLLAANDPSRVQLAQAAPAPVTSAAPAGNPWVFGMTLYFWYPWWTMDATIDGLPQASSGGSSHTSTHTTNMGGGDGEFTITKGRWGFYGNVAGGYYGAKGELLRSDPAHLNRPDRTGYLHTSAITGTYALMYRVAGEPLDLTAWARKVQPVSVDLLAGGETLTASGTFDSQRERKTVTKTMTYPVLGSRLSWDITERWNLGVSGSLGGFGVSDVDLTWQANLTVGYHFRMWDVPSAVTLGFRGQGLQFETGTGDKYLKMNGTMYGPMLGFSLYY